MAFFKEKWQKKTWKRKKKAIQDAQTYIRISTDQRQVPDVTGSGAKMAQVGVNGVFFGKTLEKNMKMKEKKMWGAVTYVRILTDQRYVPDFSGSSAKMAQKWAEMAFFFLKKPLKKT